jgi:hypothetical protein
MSNELLPLLDILAGPPKNADHEERFVAAVNGGGDGLLPHDGSLDANLGPKLDPGLDPSPHSHPQTNGAATTANHRDAATAADSPAPAPTGLANGLARVSATIRQIESVLKANGALALEAHFAIERIQDVAMALRMREVDAALCDTLEASIREVGDAIVRNDAAAARTQGAAALLCDLGKRIDQMLPPVSIVTIEPDKADGVVKPDKADGGAKSDKADGVIKPANAAVSVAVNGDHAAKPNGAGGGPTAAAIDVVSDDDHAHPLPQPAFVHPALPDMLLSAEAKQQPAKPIQPLMLSMPSPVGDNEDPAPHHEPIDQPADEAELDTDAELITDETAAAAASRDAQAEAPETPSAMSGPSAPSVAEANGAGPPTAAESNGAATSSRAPANDPLAAVYGLSEEELIALFS